MSRNSKAKRDAKKRRVAARAPSRASREPVIVAHILLDGAAYAAIGYSGKEWNLVVENGVAAGSDDPATIWKILQAIAARAELNGNTVSVQSSQQFRELVDELHSELDEQALEELADKILTVQPLPVPSAHAPLAFPEHPIEP